MKDSLPLSEDKKLSVIYRVEPGCLGPLGKSHISEFCNSAQTELSSLASDYIIWNIVPRNDKSLPELQYTLAEKRISHSQAEKYLAFFGEILDEFEGELADKLETANR